MGAAGGSPLQSQVLEGSFQGPSHGEKSCFSLTEQMQASPELRNTNPWMWLGLWCFFTWLAMARPRECLLECPFLNAPSWGALQSFLPSSPTEPQAAAIRNEVQKCCHGVAALCSTHYAWEGFLPPSLIRTMAFGLSWKAMRWLQVERE